MPANGGRPLEGTPGGAVAMIPSAAGQGERGASLSQRPDLLSTLITKAIKDGNPESDPRNMGIMS